jgi:O-antigen/teichoic acid export membrane protein
MSQPLTSASRKNEGDRDVRDGAPSPPRADVTGQERLAWNVFAGWASYFIVAATGFVAPRVMDRKLGQETLGVWDFGWSMVSYFGLTQLGVGSAVQRYVAKYRAAGDALGLRRLVSSVMGLSLASSALTLGLTIACVWWLPLMLRADLVSESRSARWVVLLLGTTIAVQLAFQLYTGVLAGCHRFDLMNAISATFEVLTAVSIVVVLLAGGGIVALGVVCLAFQLMTDLTRAVWAHRACPELRVKLTDADWGEARQLLKYGIKATVYSISSLLVIQANKLTVGGAFGLATLAVFSRPIALIGMIQSFAGKFANVLTPTASSLQSREQHAELSSLALETARLGASLALPMLLLLAVLGDPIMLLWMGSRYEPGPSMLILSLGFLGVVALAPVNAILFGMNLHGQLALATLVAAGTSALLGVLNGSVLRWGLTGAALAIALPLTASQAYLAAYACRKFGLALPRFVRYAFGTPLACVTPYVLALLASRLVFRERPLLAVLAGIGLGGPTILPLYWRFVVPEGLKTQIRRMPEQMRGAAARYMGRRRTRT